MGKKSNEYVGKRAKESNSLRTTVERYKTNHTGAKILSGALAVMGLNGLFVVYFGVNYLIDALYGESTDSGVSNFLIGLLATLIGLGICGFFIKQAFNLVNAIEANSNMKIRRISVRAFLSSIAIIIYFIVFSADQLVPWGFFMAIFGVLSLYAYASSRSNEDENYWNHLEDAEIREVKPLSENPFFED